MRRDRGLGSPVEQPECLRFAGVRTSELLWRGRTVDPKQGCPEPAAPSLARKHRYGPAGVRDHGGSRPGRQDRSAPVTAFRPGGDSGPCAGADVLAAWAERTGRRAGERSPPPGGGAGSPLRTSDNDTVGTWPCTTMVRPSRDERGRRGQPGCRACAVTTAGVSVTGYARCYCGPAWPCRTWLMPAMMTWAAPSMARATGLDGLLSWLAIWAADRPASTCGLYCAPARM